MFSWTTTKEIDSTNSPLELVAVVDADGLQPKFAVAVRGVEEVEVLAAKDLRERGRGEQEALAHRAEPALPVGQLQPRSI